MILRLNDDEYGQQHFLSHALKDFHSWGKLEKKEKIPCCMCQKEVAWALPWSIEVHTLTTRSSLSMESGTFIYGLMTDLTFCFFLGRGSINGKKTHGESSFQRSLRASAALEPSVYFTLLIPWMGNTGYIVKFIRRCTIYLTLIPFHHVCINKGFSVCKKH